LEPLFFMARGETKEVPAEKEEEQEMRYRLALVGSLPVHPLTTMAMLPWVVAQIVRPGPGEREWGRGGPHVGGHQNPPKRNQSVFLTVSASRVQCLSAWAEGAAWDPLSHTVLFECLPHRVTKLIYNSQEPSSFGCLIRDGQHCACYVFQCQDSTRVPEIISTLGLAIAQSCPSFSSISLSPTAFAKKFEVLFCGRVTVAHKKAPPALIDECIEKFSQSRGSGESPTAPRRPLLYKRDPSFPCLQALDENGLSPEITLSHADDAHCHSTGVRPTSLQENRTMLFMVGRSQIFLVSPDTKKVAIEKSFREISFCSQGIHHVDHFGFICRETVDGASCHFVCYVFQCTDESLVDEIMLTLKQAFSVAALQQSVRTQSQQCDSCPMQQLHRLCERIEGLQPSKTKLELQRHLATLDNEAQADVFENKMRAKSEQEENEMVMASLRSLYEERQKGHQHSQPGESKGHNSTGDLKRLDPCSSPLSPSPGGTPQQQQQQGFRRRASTYSHPPTPTSPKLVRHYSVSTDTPHQSNPGLMHVVGESPLRSQRHSWRQQIFLRVATPQKNSDSIERGEGGLEAYGGAEGGGAGGDPAPPGTPGGKRKSGEELRELWRKAILQQILLLRMETENQRLQASASDLQNKRLKQDYEEITPCLKDVTLVWERMLATPGRSKVKFDSDTIHAAVTQGVPRPQRGEIWKLLSEQYVLRQTVPARPPANQTPYKDLLKQLTSQQHAILIDLGRTFPTHPYFQAQLGAGQLSLYNLLKAYSLLDPEVGYCQGLSFIAGVLLLHLEEEQAFDMLKFLMYDMGLRKQYRPDMIILQIQMYQLSRLLHDYHRDLHSHLELHEIGPSLYATPWFLTVFASHFPLGFVARVFDMLFLQGSEVIFKVALSLLGSHKPLILQHDSLESIVDFIKTTLPNLGLVQMEKTINQVCQMDVSKQLQAYEVEYHVLQDELMDTPPTLSQSQRVAQLERTNQSLRQQNRDLLEELQVSQARVAGLEGRLEGLARSEGQLREQVCGLEEEARGLQGTVSRLHTLLTGLGVHTSAEGELIARPRSPDQQRPWAAGHPPGTEGLGKGTPDPLPEPLALPGGL
uniref:TBC1 domain family member 1 n=1 Tax=Gadus morhua TaxID=8049 RepID=A0A8C5AL64_GADMO